MTLGSRREAGVAWAKTVVRVRAMIFRVAVGRPPGRASAGGGRSRSSGASPPGRRSSRGPRWPRRPAARRPSGTELTVASRTDTETIWTGEVKLPTARGTAASGNLGARVTYLDAIEL